MWDSKREKKEQILGYFFILPAVIYMLAFIGYPIIYNWIISFQNVTAKTIASAARRDLQEGFGPHLYLYHWMLKHSVYPGLFICHILHKEIHPFQTHPRFYRYQLDASGDGDGPGVQVHVR